MKTNQATIPCDPDEKYLPDNEFIHLKMGSTKYQKLSRLDSYAVANIHTLSDDQLVSITVATHMLGRSRASIYRHFDMGELTKISVGQSTRIRVGEIRALMGAGS